MSAPQLSPGQVVAGKYTIRSVLGAWGTMATYAAQAAGRDVVVRMLSPQLAQRGDVLGALQQAGAFTNALPADASAPILESAFDPQTGAPYTVTELLSVPSLAKAAQNGPLPVADVVLILQGLARTVDAAHGKRIAHGGIKPQNVFVGSAPQKTPRLIDFGMALVRAAMPTNEGRANAAPWLAPEQLQGGPGTPATDVFAAALVAFFAATGKSYWRSCQGAQPDLAGLQQELAGPRVAASTRARELGASLSQGFDPILTRALALNPGERYPTVTELAEAVAKGGGPPRLAMTMPLNAAPFNAKDLMRQGPGAGTPAPPATNAPVGGDTLAIQSPLEATQWAPQAAAQPSPQRSQPSTQAVPQQPMPSLQAQAPMQQPMGQPQMAPQQMPMLAPMPPMQQPMMAQPMMPPQGAYGGGFQSGPPGPAQAAYGAPPESRVVVPKSRTGLIVGLVILVVVLAGAGVGAVLFVRSREAVVVTPAATAAATAPPPTTAAGASTTAQATSTAAPPAATAPAAATAAPSASAAQDTTAPAAWADAAAPAASQATGAVAPDQATLSIACVPECDTIKVDDKLLDNDADASTFPSPATVNLSTGPHLIAVGRATYASQTRRVTLKAGQKDKVAFYLAKPGAAAPAPKCGKFLERCP